MWRFRRLLVLFLIVLNIVSLFTVFLTLPVSGEVPWKGSKYRPQESRISS